ncbi:hypothetical protein FB451DRAFT_1236660 [Mycena latifolia]|nr:hypothetical protein FB451DRAFT_1236660 [Mycena latifolia]
MVAAHAYDLRAAAKMFSAFFPALYKINCISFILVSRRIRRFGRRYGSHPDRIRCIRGRDNRSCVWGDIRCPRYLKSRYIKGDADRGVDWPRILPDMLEPRYPATARIPARNENPSYRHSSCIPTVQAFAFPNPSLDRWHVSIYTIRAALWNRSEYLSKFHCCILTTGQP